MADDIPLNVSRDPTEGPALKSTGGRTVKRAMVQDARRLNLLPLEALPHLWEVLGPLLSNELSRERFHKIAGPFCEKHRVQMGDLIPGIAAVRTLLRAAAKEDLSIGEFVDDMEVCGIDVPVGRVIAEGYPKAIVMIRSELSMAALMDHGAVLQHVDWRLDQLRSCSRIKNVNAPVPTLTFHYREGDEDRRLSLQVIGPVLKSLRGILDELLADSDDERAEAESAAGGGDSSSGQNP